MVQWISLQLSMEYCSYQITIFANLPPPKKCRLVRAAPPAPPSLRLWLHHYMCNLLHAINCTGNHGLRDKVCCSRHHNSGSRGSAPAGCSCDWLRAQKRSRLEQSDHWLSGVAGAPFSNIRLCRRCDIGQTKDYRTVEVPTTSLRLATRHDIFYLLTKLKRSRDEWCLCLCLDHCEK